MARTKVHGEYLDPSVISAQTEVTAVGSDHMLIFDATDNALKKALLSDLIETVGSTPTFTSLTVDDITINGSTISDGGDLTIDVGGILNLDADNGGNINFKDGGTHYGTHQNENGDYRIISIVQDKDIILRGNDGGTFFNALTLDMSDAGRASFNNKASFNNAIAVGQSSFSGGSVLADFHGDGNGVGSQLAFANDHNTDKFYVGIEGNTTGDAFLYQAKNADINFYTNNNFKAKLDNLGNFGIGTSSPVNYGSGSQGLTINGTGNYQNLNLQVGGTTQFTIYTNGVSGTFINQLTADPMMFYTSDTERMRITSTGGVEVGDGTNYGYLKVISDDAVTGYFDRRNGSGTILQFRQDDSTIGSLNIQSSTLQIGTGNTQLAFSDADDAFFVKNEAGANRDGSHDLGKSSAKFKDLYLSGNVKVDAGQGILFGGAAGASGMTSQVLDDYEEGTWTPACGATLSTAVGHYTKIGNQVTVHYHIVSTGSLPSSTGQVIITGLPFTSSSSILTAAPIYARYYTPNDSTLTSLIQDSETQIRLININDTNFDYTIWGELEASANNSIYIIGTATYQV